MDDPSSLDRFLDAQTPVYERVLAELRSDRKTSHWMWFVFPQLRGLGTSPTAEYFGISSRAEAEAYLNHPVLGARIVECSQLVNSIDGRSLDHIFGYPDNLKFRSCMTLFALISPENDVFRKALDKFCAGEPDPRTLHLLAR